MNTAAIIEKWYQKIGFDSRYDREFYDALISITDVPSATIDAYNYSDPNGRAKLHKP